MECSPSKRRRSCSSDSDVSLRPGPKDLVEHAAWIENFSNSIFGNTTSGNARLARFLGVIEHGFIIHEDYAGCTPGAQCCATMEEFLAQKGILNSGWPITWRVCDNNVVVLKYYETITEPRHRPLHTWKGVEEMVSSNFKCAVDDVKPTEDMPRAECL